MVSKFGTAENEERTGSAPQSQEQSDGQPWLGAGAEIGAEDGAIFLGVGALPRQSLRNITYWMEDMYTLARMPTAYSTARQHLGTGTREQRQLVGKHPEQQQLRRSRASKTITPSSDAPGSAVVKKRTSPETGSEAGGMDRFMNYLTLGYGTAWTLGGTSALEAQGGLTQDAAAIPELVTPRKPRSTGCYLIGLMGEIEELDEDSGTGPSDANHGKTPDLNSRTLLRTLTVERESGDAGIPETEVTRDSRKSGYRADGHEVGQRGLRSWACWRQIRQSRSKQDK